MFRNFLVLLFWLAAVPSLAQAQDWNQLPMPSEDGSTMWWRPAGQSPENPDWRRIDTKMELPSVQVFNGFATRSVLSPFEVDCANQRIRDVNWTAYAEPNLGGASQTFPPDGKWLSMEGAPEFMRDACRR